VSVEPRASGAGAALPERDDELAEVDLVGAVLVEDGEDALREPGPVEVEVVEHLPELEAPAPVLVDLQELRVQPRDVGLVEPQALEGVAELVDAVVVVDARAEGPLQSQADVPGQQVQERVEQRQHGRRMRRAPPVAVARRSAARRSTLALLSGAPRRRAPTMVCSSSCHAW
jgi:hypothetical protein